MPPKAPAKSRVMFLTESAGLKGDRVSPQDKLKHHFTGKLKSLWAKISTPNLFRSPHAQFRRHTLKQQLKGREQEDPRD